MNPKQLLLQQAEKDKKKLKEVEEEVERERIPIPSELNDAPGKQGFLWREGANPFGISGVESTARVWVTLLGNKLLFSEPISGNMSENAFIANSTDRSCLGYIVITPNTTVQIKYTNKTTGIGSSSSRRFGFEVIEKQEGGDNATTTIVLYTEEDSDRTAWMNMIEECRDGRYMVLSHAVISIPLFTKRYAPYTQSFAKSNVQQIEFPKKEGYLKKTTVGNTTFGLTKVKKRYFVLQQGEFCYFEDENDSKVSKVKDTMDLDSAQLLDSTAREEHVILLQLINGRTLRLDAADAATAKEWRQVIQETLQLLELRNGGNQQNVPNKEYANKTRRYNLHEYVSNEDLLAKRQAAQASAAQAATSPASFFSRRSSGRDAPPPPPPGGSTSPTTPPLTARARSSTTSSTSPTTGSLKLTSPGELSTGSMRLVTSGSIYKTPQVLELLKTAFSQHFLFKPFTMNENHLQPIYDLLQEKYTTAGEVIVWQGGFGDLFYIVDQGLCEIVKDHKVLGTIKPGSSFGEMALINSAVRQATIRSLVPCKLWTLHRNDFRDLIKQQNVKNLKERLEFLRQVDLFSDFVDTSLEKIAEVMDVKNFPSGDKIIRQGDYGDLFYMIVSGRVVVTQQNGLSLTSTAPSVELVRLTAGKYFGEKALLENAPRKATVTATSTVTCYTIDRQNFVNLFGSMQEAKQENLGLKMLKKVKVLESLNERQLMSVAKCLTKETFQPSETIIKQGDTGDSFYMIASGEVSVQVNHIQVAVLEGGSFFGEMSLISNDKRSATIIAVKETNCFVLSRQNFTELLGPLEEIIKNEAAQRQQQQQYQERRNSSWSKWFGASGGTGAPGGSSPTGPTTSSSTTSSAAATKRKSLAVGSSGSQHSNTVQFNAAAIFNPHSVYARTNHIFHLSDVEKVKKISYGTFGTIYLVHHTTTGKYYSMKQISKEYLLHVNQEKNASTERDIALSLSGNFFIVELYATLQDAKCISYIHHYMPHGDLWQLLYSRELPKSKQGGIPLTYWSFYAANVLAIIQALHDHDIVYRDLKPENFMLDSTGYLRIIDFGSAKIIKLGERSSTICGTPEYLPPEMVLSKEYNRAVDFWNVGILFYELFARNTPFMNPNLILMYQHIIDPEVTLTTAWAGLPSSGIDPGVKQLINRLLLENPASRIGMQYKGIQDIWDSSIFSKPSAANNNAAITFDRVSKKQLTVPHMPVADDGNQQQNTALDTLDFIDMLEDPDEVPEYTGNFDYSEF